MNLLLLIVLSGNTYAFWGMKGEFKFDFDKGLCLNSKNQIGQNVNEIGECADLRKMGQKKLSKEQLYKRNLRGSNLDGLNLSGLDLEESNLYFTTLRGTNLKNALLKDAYLEGARYNSKTILPFGDVEAYSRGMINEDFSLRTDSNNTTVTFRDLEDESPEWVKRNLLPDGRPSQAYHQRLLNLVKNARKLTLPMLDAVVESAFYQAFKYEADLNQVAQNELAAYQKALRLSDALEASVHINGMIMIGIEKAEEATLPAILNTLSKLFPVEVTAKNFNATNLAFVKALSRFESLEQSDLHRLLELAQKKRAITATVIIAERIAKEKETTTAIELNRFMLENVALENRDYVMMESVKRLKSINDEELTLLLPLAQKTGKDALLLQYLELSKSLSISKLVELQKLAFSAGHDIRMGFLNKLESFTLNELRLIVAVAKEKEIDTLINTFVTRENHIDAATLIEALKLGVNPRIVREIILANLNRITGLQINRVSELASFLLEYDKDTLLFYYSGLVTTLTTKDFLTLLNLSFNKFFDLTDQNITKVSDLTLDTLISLGRGYYGHSIMRDDLFLKGMTKLTDLTEAGLERLLFYTVYKKDEVRRLGKEILSRRG